jgi:hypothetical protein
MNLGLSLSGGESRELQPHSVRVPRFKVLGGLEPPIGVGSKMAYHPFAAPPHHGLTHTIVVSIDDCAVQSDESSLNGLLRCYSHVVQ